MGNYSTISSTDEFYIQNNLQSTARRFNLNDPNVYAQMWAQILTQRQILLQQKMLIRMQKEQYRKNMLEKKYPVKYVIFHAIFILTICIAIIVLQFIMKNAYNALAGLFVSAYLISTITIALFVSEYFFFCCIVLRF